MLSLTVKGSSKASKKLISERYVELKIQDEDNKYLRYDVHALTPDGEPVVLLENSDFNNQVITLKIPSNANYFMVNRKLKGKNKRQLFKINPLQTVAVFGGKSRISAD